VGRENISEGKSLWCARGDDHLRGLERHAVYYGGGIPNYQGDFSLGDSTISHNHASMVGGIQNFNGGDPQLRRVNFNENTASSGAGLLA